MGTSDERMPRGGVVKEQELGRAEGGADPDGELEMAGEESMTVGLCAGNKHSFVSAEGDPPESAWCTRCKRTAGDIDREQTASVAETLERFVTTEEAGEGSPLDLLRELFSYEGNDVAEGILQVEKYVRVVERRTFGEVAAVLALHKPAPVEVELWCHDEGVTPLHDADFPDCADGTCAGHLRTIPSCMECGYEVDYDGTVNYTKWPCSTARALGVTE